MNEENISVVEAIIKNKNGEILLLKRSKENKHYVGKWQLPGGKVEFGEKIDLAIKREILEEIGIKYKDIKLLKVFSLENGFSNGCVKNVFLMVFETNFFGDVKIGKDHVEYKFFKINDIKKNSLTHLSKKSIFG